MIDPAGSAPSPGDAPACAPAPPPGAPSPATPLEPPPASGATPPSSGPGFSARCACCVSPHRAEVDRRLLANEPTRSIAAWLEATHGVSISHKGLANHKNEHLGVAEAVRERSLAAAAPVFEGAVQSQLAEVAHLDRQIRRTSRLIGRMTKALEKVLVNAHLPVGEDEPAVLSHAHVALVSALLREHRAYLETRREFLGGSKKGSSSDLDEALKKGLGNLLGLAFSSSPGASASGKVGG